VWGDLREVLRRDSLYLPVRDSCFDSNTLMHLIVSMRGCPLGSDAGDVMDVMDTWGRNYSLCWYNSVCSYINTLWAREDPVQKKTLFYGCIVSYVKEILDSYSYSVYSALLLQWQLFFESEYSGGFAFFAIAQKSIFFTQDMVNQMQTTAPTPAVIESSP
jgi:hypothetical protein